MSDWQGRLGAIGLVSVTYPLCNLHMYMHYIPMTHISIFFINPWHAYAARVTVVVLCVCVSGHAILALCAIRSMKDTIVLSVRFAAILKWLFSLKLSYSKIRAVFTYTVPRPGQPFLVNAYPACNVSYILHYMFAYT